MIKRNYIKKVDNEFASPANSHNGYNRFHVRTGHLGPRRQRVDDIRVNVNGNGLGNGCSNDAITHVFGDLPNVPVSKNPVDQAFSSTTSFPATCHLTLCPRCVSVKCEMMRDGDGGRQTVASYQRSRDLHLRKACKLSPQLSHQRDTHAPPPLYRRDLLPEHRSASQPTGQRKAQSVYWRDSRSPRERDIDIPPHKRDSEVTEKRDARLSFPPLPQKARQRASQKAYPHGNRRPIANKTAIRPSQISPPFRTETDGSNSNTPPSPIRFINSHDTFTYPRNRDGGFGCGEMHRASCSPCANVGHTSPIHHKYEECNKSRVICSSNTKPFYKRQVNCVAPEKMTEGGFYSWNLMSMRFLNPRLDSNLSDLMVAVWYFSVGCTAFIVLVYLQSLHYLWHIWVSLLATCLLFWTLFTPEHFWMNSVLY